LTNSDQLIAEFDEVAARQRGVADEVRRATFGNVPGRVQLVEGAPRGHSVHAADDPVTLVSSSLLSSIKAASSRLTSSGSTLAATGSTSRTGAPPRTHLHGLEDRPTLISAPRFRKAVAVGSVRFVGVDDDQLQ
jgi:hypothetical protein